MGTAVRSVEFWRIAPAAVEAFKRNGLINFAAAMSFLVVLSIVPFLLFVFALLGFLQLEEVWREDVAPEIRGSVSEAAFRVIDDTVTKVLTQKQIWWVTAGFALALWEISAAARVTMTALDRIYGLGRRRGFLELFARSVLLGLAMCVAILGALAVVRFVPLLTGELDGVLAVVSFVVRWVVAAALLGTGVGLMVHYGPGIRQTLPWVSFGTALVMVAWIGMSILFGLYVTYVADYASVFGHLATFFVLLIYVYASSIAFLTGVQVDACVRETAEE
jgi:membrane protein